MRSSLIKLALLLAIMLAHASLGLTANLNSLLDSAKEAFNGDSSVTNNEIIQGLKEALEIGSQNAVAMVSKPDGYFKNSDIKIPLPEKSKRPENIFELLAMGPKLMNLNRA